MNIRPRTGILCCVVPCLLIYLRSYVSLDAVKCFNQRRNPWHLKNSSNKEDPRFPLKPKNKEKLHILIIAYFRSGSTLTGSMFDTNSDSFYSFEPLHTLPRYLYEDQITMFYLNGTKVNLQAKLARRQTIENILHCKLSQLSINVLHSKFWEHPEASRSYWNCIMNSHVKLDDCLRAFEKSCSQKKVTVIKTIRLAMEEVKEILLTYKSLKVIHLVRDPRPSIYSSKRWGSIETSLEEYASSHCRSIYNDIIVTKQLLKTHAEKVKLVFYEDMTIDMMGVVKDIYDFVGLPFTSEIQDHIKHLAAKDEKNCFMCLGRSNATYQLNKWRMTMPFEDVKIIDSKCGMLYDMLGYKPAGSQLLLRDLNRPLRESIMK